MMPKTDRRISMVERIGTLAETRFLASLSIILLLGAVLRVAVIEMTTAPAEPLNIVYPGYTDGYDYANIARSVLDHGVYGYAGRPTAFRPPAYPLFIAFIWRIFGETLTVVRLFQIALFVIMAVAYTHITMRYFGRVPALLMALMLSLYPLFLFLTTEIATESLYMALMAVVFLLTFLVLEERNVRRKVILAFCAGMSCGAGILTRPNMVFIFFLFQALLIIQRIRSVEGNRNWIAASIALSAGTFLLLAPWMIRNQFQFGAPVLATNLQYNFFRGTFDLAPSTPNDAAFIKVFADHNVMYEQEVEDTRNRQLPISEVESERNARAAALAIIRADPVIWLKERGKNLLYLWLNLHWDGELLRKQPIALVAATSVSIIYYVILTAAIIGSIQVWRNRVAAEQRHFLLVTWLFITAAMPVIITFVGKRYRISMIDPYLVLLSCIGVGSWFHRLIETRGVERIGSGRTN